MEKKVPNVLIGLLLFLLPSVIFGQSPPSLGMAANFVLFTSNGAVTHTGAGINSHITGNVGENIGGPTTGFGNIDGQMHNLDVVTAAAVIDLNIAYLNLISQGPSTAHALLFGGETVSPGIYATSVGVPSSIGGILTLDGGGNQNAYFLFKIGFDFSTSAFAQVKLINGAKACNVFWVVEGAVNLATGTKMRGNIIAHNGAIGIATGVLLEGRALSTTGAIAVNTGLTAYTPIGCGSPVLTGPAMPNLGTTACYALLTANGAMSNTGISKIIGDVGSNGGGTVTGYTPAMVTGTLHTVPDGSTSQASTDIGVLAGYLNSLPYDIELLYPSQLGHSLVLTPHVYFMSAANPPPPLLTDTIFFNAEGNPNAVFVIQMNAAFTTMANSKVVLINGAKSSNIFWLVNSGSVDINTNSSFRGTIVSNPGAIRLFIGDTLDGRALSTNGAITTQTVNMAINSSSSSITPNGPTSFCLGDSVKLTANSGTSYTWSNGKFTQSITVKTSGDYSVTVGGSNSCGSAGSSGITKVTVINPLPSFITANRPVNFCKGDSVRLTANNATTYKWSSGQSTQSIVVYNSGNYSVLATNVASCKPQTYSAVTKVSVDTLPKAGFTSNLTGGMTYSFINTSKKSINYIWAFGDGQSSASASPTHVYASFGTYLVKLIVHNNCGSDSITEIIVFNDMSLDFYNGFSPNGDGHNDDWQIPVLNYNSNNTVVIINRWGDEVWKGINYDNKTIVWTGKNMIGNNLPDGNYYYIIKYGNAEKRGWVFVER
jgi:gliding motility-associated-like protein